MNNKEILSNSDLIISNKNCSDNNRSILFYRGLDLIKKIENKKVEILIGNVDDVCNNFFIQLIEFAVNKKFEVNVKCLFHGEDLLKYGNKIKVDMFIIYANNITFYEKYSLAAYVRNVLDIIDTFKNTYKIPVIVFCGSSKYHDLMLNEEIATDFYFRMPFDPYNFIDSVKKCLKIGSCQDDITIK